MRDRVKHNEGSKRWYYKNRDKAIISMRDRRKKVGKAYDLKKCYGLELEEYNNMVRKTMGMCPICFRHFTNESKYHKPHVDHSHETGLVRGILCGYCNVALGFLKEDPDTMLRLRDYIIEANGGPEQNE